MLGDKGRAAPAKDVRMPSKDGVMLKAESKAMLKASTRESKNTRESAPKSSAEKYMVDSNILDSHGAESKTTPESKAQESARPRIAVLADFDTTKRPRPHRIIALLKDIAEVFVIAREQSDERGAHCFSFPAPAESAATRSAEQKARIAELCQKGDFAPLIYTPNRASISDILRSLPRLDLLIVEDIALLPFACDYKREVLQADSIAKESKASKAESTQSNAPESAKPAESTKSRALDSTTPESTLLDSAFSDSTTRPAPKIICDLREFYPLEYEDEAWQAGLGRFFTHLCAHYLKEADLCLCISEAICARYERDFGIAPRLYLSLPPHLDALHYKKLRNAAQKRQMRESTARHRAPKPKPPKARILYHGFISRDRDSLNLLRLARLLGDEYELHCMVVCNDALFLRDFCMRAKRQRNIRIIPPVPMSDIIAQSVNYDIGILTLQPNSFNNAHAMPNKLFEYIQSRLCVISTPIPSVRAFLRDFGAGRVAIDFSVQSLARTIRAITRQSKCHQKHAAPQDKMRINRIQNLRQSNAKAHYLDTNAAINSMISPTAHQGKPRNSAISSTARQSKYRSSMISSVARQSKSRQKRATHKSNVTSATKHQDASCKKRIFHKSRSPLAYRQTLAQHFCKTLSIESNRAKLHQILRELNIIP